MFLYSISVSNFLKFIKLKLLVSINKCILNLKTLSNFELYLSAIIFLNISIIDSVFDNISPTPLANKSTLSSLLLKSITLVLFNPPISSSIALCGSITTTLYLILLLLSFAKFLIISLINLDFPVPLAPITTLCLSKSKSVCFKYNSSCKYGNTSAFKIDFSFYNFIRFCF